MPRTRRMRPWWLGLSVGALAGAGGCGQFTGSPLVDATDGATNVADSAAAPIPGPSDAQARDASVGSVDACSDAAPCETGEAPQFLLSPYADVGLSFPRVIDWTLAVEPTTPFRYTTDGSDPTPSSPISVGVASMRALAGGTTIKWVVGGSTKVHSFRAQVDAATGNGVGAILEGFAFDTSQSPILRVTTGVTAVSAKANVQFWSQSNCPTCITQVIVGTTAGTSCLSGTPGVYPGLGSAFTIIIRVPATPGVYPVRVGTALEYSCATTAGNPLSAMQVGTLIVEAAKGSADAGQ
jgi:hypothetical protein